MLTVNHPGKEIAAPEAARLERPEAVREAYLRRFGEAPRLYAAPGRVNLIGEHTDYNEGFVLPAAVDRYTWLAAGPRDDDLLRVQLWRDREAVDIDLRRLEPAGSGAPEEYLKGVAWALREAGVALAGCNLVLGGDIPLGGGLSSSASLEAVLAWTLVERSGARLPREQLAQLCRRAEAEFVGMPCGIMDQYAVMLGRAGHALFLDCRSLRCEPVPLPEPLRLLVVHSGVSHRLHAGGYAQRRDECTAAVAALRRMLPGLTALRDLEPGQLESVAGRLEHTLHRRCRHVVGENGRVQEARDALRAGDRARLGALLDASHASLRDDYEVSCPEVDRLAEIARDQPGVWGSRLMGGGFGGCVISLVDADFADTAAAGIAEAYGALLGHRPWMHVAGPADPVGEWRGRDDAGLQPGARLTR